MISKVLVLALIGSFFVGASEAKVYDRCQFVRLIRRHLPANEIDDWTCIAKHESGYRTDAINFQNIDGSVDYGIFQINDRYWCRGRGEGSNICGVRCEELMEDDLLKSIRCAKIVKQRQRFAAWVAWNDHCSHGRARGYAGGC